MKKLKIGDLMLLFILISMTLFFAMFKTQKGDRIVVEVKGNVIKTIDLATDTQFVYQDKYKNIITIKDGKAFVSFSDCPDKSCVHSGQIDSDNRIICCLPNELVIRVVASKQKLDVISG